MRMRLLLLTAILLSPMAAMADGYHHQRGYTTQRTCYKEIYKEEYVAGTRKLMGYVKSYLDKVEVPCSSLSWIPPVPKYRYHNNHVHYFPHTHRRYYKPTHQKVLVSHSYRTSGSTCNSSNTTTGGLLGGGLAAAISKKDAYAWSIPLGAVLGMGIANADC
ncbi:hypothetical protein [Prochlorococcus marinus]|uniref:hypothetical protein n=1 Tax=Prochlorococcus marinus TaxID=1219 RepID=UPI0022B2E7A4|nr:hypothetical protein [Prochlorococcus marinus]